MHWRDPSPDRLLRTPHTSASALAALSLKLFQPAGYILTPGRRRVNEAPNSLPEALQAGMRQTAREKALVKTRLASSKTRSAESAGWCSAMRSELRELLESILELVYPKKCFACECIGHGYICPQCLEDIRPIPEPFCRICGEPGFDGLCPSCTQKTPAFTWARAVGLFDGILRDAIHKLKYEGQTYLAQDLGLLLARHLENSPSQKFDAVVPVPIHRKRERQRGFNQSQLLAKQISERTGTPLLERALVRTIHTRPQVDLGREARLLNVENAFAVPNPQKVQGLRILLIDDVMTTGATCNAASTALLAAGARSVAVMTLARQP